MATVTIRNLSDEAHRALKLRAKLNRCSLETETRAILEAAARPEARLQLGSALVGLSRRFGLTDAEVEAIDQARDRRPAEPMQFD